MHAMRKRIASLAALSAVLAGGLGPMGVAQAAQPETVTDVAALDDYFMPADLTVPAGTTVRWTNRGANPHTSTSDTGLWSSGNLAPGQEHSYTFVSPGLYTYHCTLHRAAGMVGRVMVTSGGVPPGAGTNLARGRPVLASSALPGYPALNAVDGDLASFWASTAARPGELAGEALPDVSPANGGPSPDGAKLPEAAVMPDAAGNGDALPDAAPDLPDAAPASHNYEWIMVDLGAQVPVQRLRMLWTAHFARGYYVYVHLPWACGGWCRAATVGNGAGDDTVMFSRALTLRYVLLQLVFPAVPGGHYELREWEIFGTGTVPAPSQDVAAHRLALASSQRPGHEAVRATDRNLSTEWRTAGGAGWLAVDFGQPYVVSQAVLRWTNGWHASGYELYFWNGFVWRRVFVTTTGNGGDEVVLFGPVRTRHLLVYGFRGPGPGVGLKEFEVYTAIGTGYPLAGGAMDLFPGSREVAPETPADLPDPSVIPAR